MAEIGAGQCLPLLARPHAIGDVVLPVIGPHPVAAIQLDPPAILAERCEGGDDDAAIRALRAARHIHTCRTLHMAGKRFCDVSEGELKGKHFLSRKRRREHGETGSGKGRQA